MSDNGNYVIMKKGSEPTDLEKEVFERLLRLLPIITSSKDNLTNFDIVMLNLYGKKCTECLVKTKIQYMIENLKQEDFK